MRSIRRRREEDEPPTLLERLVMAALAPIMFNVSILIVIGTFFKRGRFLEKLLAPTLLTSPWLLGFLLIGLPAITGFVLGVNRLATLLGHFFMTNDGEEMSPLKTLLAWGGLFLLIYLISRLVD